LGIAGGGLYAWGNNDIGQLGTGDVTLYSVPTQVGALTTWTNIAASQAASPQPSHSLGIRAGKLYSWGSNSQGQLGDSTGADKSSPVQVGALTNWTCVATEAIASHGISGSKLFSWGYGAFSELGDGTTNSYNSPVQIGSLTVWTLVAGAFWDGHALKVK